MKDNAFRKAVKAVARWRYRVDLRITRFFHRPSYRLAGNCARCGACCRTPSIPVSPIFLYPGTTRRLILAWHRIINGFELEQMDRKGGILVFRCTHYNPHSGLCDSYSSRPGMCRDYPENLVSSPFPTFLEGCGFRAVARNADSFSRALQESGLPPETVSGLKIKLHLE
ncbi:MAG: YkgJ family cysteine cluster protein [Desulfobacterales bacterium]